jgi:hypothetical protein
MRKDQSICSWGIGAKADFPEKELANALVHSFLEHLRWLFNNELAGELFIEVLPFFRRQKEWTPWKLFRALKYEEVALPIQSHTRLKRYLDGFVMEGLLTQVDEKVVAYALNEAGSIEVQFLTQVVPNHELKDALEDEFKYLHTTICYVARLLRKFLPKGSAHQAFDLSSVIVSALGELATRDLESRQVLEHQCAACYYAPDPTASSPKRAAVVEKAHQVAANKISAGGI